MIVIVQNNRYETYANSLYAVKNLSNILLKYLSEEYNSNYKELVFICIGTDKSTGDSLGALVGSKLSSTLSKYKNTYILGTLDKPIHAKNLQSTIEFIKDNFMNPFVIAIDASLSKYNQIGMISIKKGAIMPGSGVNKTFPTIGNISITGVVNSYFINCIDNYEILQNTRLSLVVNMANIISRSITKAIHRYNILSSNRCKYSIFKKHEKDTWGKEGGIETI